ncbi:MAG: methyl-accepting chemotaxis protein [Capsulimonadaceae bacterium]|nr:methyl-accepting chemotaxis protein [Capsulimonadaceae bacterium]
MAWLINLKVAQKLVLAFGACVAFSVVAGVVSINRMAALNNSGSQIVNESLANSQTLAKLVNDYKQYRISELRAIVAQDKPTIGKMIDQTQAYGVKVDEDLQAYSKLATDVEDKQNAKQLGDDWAQVRSFQDEIIKAAWTNNAALGDKAINADSQSASNAVRDLSDTMMEWNKAHGQQLARQSQATFVAARATMVAILLALVIFCAGIGLAITRYILRNLSEVASRMKSLDGICLTNLAAAVRDAAQGDLTTKITTGTTPIDVRSKDEFGELATTVNSMVGQAQRTIGDFRDAQSALSTLIGSVANSAEAIASSSAEVATGNDDLSARTSEQASSLEETAASMEEMTSIVKQSAEHARDANRIASEASVVAQSGGAIVSSAVAAMAEIGQASRSITEIVSVIDEIAFQTNLLALNAAVEAARVGEQGRGFAVVAGEVRNLAGRSSTAAKEIKTLVQDSARKVEEGTKLVNKSGEQLTEIVASVDKVAEIIAGISAAAQEQSAGIEQVNKAVISMDEITQQNAALVEEATAASQTMSEQALHLRDQVRRFKVDSSLASVAQAPAAQQVRELATGTHGKASISHGHARPSSKPALRLSDAASMYDEF